MKNRTVFQELSRFMPENEREELLRKLKSSLTVPGEPDEKQYHRELDSKERDRVIEKDIKKLGWFSRIILWLKSKIGGKSIRELYLASRVNKLKREISGRYPGITGFETRDLSPKLAQEIFGIYALTIQLRKIYQQIWTRTEYFERMFMVLLEGRLQNVKTKLNDLVPEAKLEQIFLNTKSKEAMRTEIISALDTYTDSLSNEVFNTLEEELKPLYFTKDIILYQFISFFQLFHFTPIEDDLGRKTYFKNASAMLCLDHLEKLHYALHAVAQLPASLDLSNDIGMYMNMLKQEVLQAEKSSEDNQKEATAGENSQSMEEKNVEENGSENQDAVNDILQKLILRCHAVFKSLPIEEIIRYFLKDPYYQLVRTVPELTIKDLYVSSIRLRFLAELEKKYPEIRKRVVENEIKELFSQHQFVNFRHYREYSSIDYKKMGLPFFAHIRSVTLIFNYIRAFYQGQLQEAAQLLDRVVLSQNRIMRDRLIQHTASVADLEEKIRQFDYSLSPESEDGRLFQQLRFTMIQDPSKQKIYKTLVVQKDREVTSLIDRSIEALAGLEGVFNEVLTSQADNIKSQLNNNFFMKGQPVLLSRILAENKDHINKFRSLVDYVVKLERGAKE